MYKNIFKKNIYFMLNCKFKSSLSQLYLFTYTVYWYFYFNFCLSVLKIIKKLKKKKNVCPVISSIMRARYAIAVN